MLKGVERADVVEMAVSECDPFDRAARLRGGCYQVIGGAAERRVNEREAIVLTDEIGVDRTESGELKQVIGKLGGPHGSNSGTGFPYPVQRHMLSFNCVRVMPFG